MKKMKKPEVNHIFGKLLNLKESCRDEEHLHHVALKNTGYLIRH
jgi:hypothetical protein